jgi:hypothetical protein
MPKSFQRRAHSDGPLAATRRGRGRRSASSARRTSSLAGSCLRNPSSDEQYGLKAVSTREVWCLVRLLGAAMMPVEALPAASWRTVLGLGFLSAVFDNIPLTALALKQGGYDWALLAYAVGFGGSMMWFGSSAGVALSNEFPKIRSVVGWVRDGWFIPIAYVAGFFALLAVGGS